MVLGQGPRREVRPGSIGQPIPGTRVAVMDDDYRELADGEIGHFLIEAGNSGFFIGYHKDRAKTDEVVRDGWYHTGDTGCLDEDGHLFLTGRLNQTINRGGETVNPQEVDDVLMAHPAVAQAASFGVAHRTLGEDVAAAVVLEPSATATEPELRGFVAERLATWRWRKRVG